jgi:hypothetical protein
MSCFLEQSRGDILGFGSLGIQSYLSSISSCLCEVERDEKGFLDV